MAAMQAHSFNVDAAVRPSLQGGAGSAAAEALRVIRAAKQHRHGPAFLTAAPVPPHVGRYGFMFSQLSLVWHAFLVVINARLCGSV